VQNRVLISGYIGFGNAGDEAIAQTMTEHLREQVPGAEITIISGDPGQTAAALGVKAIGWREPLAIAEAVRNTDLTIVGGGGLFHDYWGFDPSAVLTREQAGLSHYVAPALLAAVYGKPVMLYAVGVGPLFSEHGRRYTKAVADVASRVTVRDAPSKELLESLGIAAEKVELTGDPAFDLKPADVDLPGAGEGPVVAVSVRNWIFGTDQRSSEREIAAALDAFLQSEGGRAVFLPFHFDPADNDDLAAARRIASKMRYADRAHVVAERCSPAVLAGMVKKADLVLGMRLHSLIFSLPAGVPFVALEYDPKVGGVAAMSGLEEFALPIGGIEADVLAERMGRALREKRRFAEIAARHGEEWRRQARRNAAIAAEMLRDSPAAPAYGPDAHALMGRMVMTQVAVNECLGERVRAAYEALGEPPAGMMPAQMVDALGRNVRELQKQLWERVQELKAAQEELVSWRKREEEFRTVSEQLEQARLQAATAQKQLEMESRKLDRTLAEMHGVESQLAAAAERAGALEEQNRAWERKIAQLEARSPESIPKRGLQVCLDAMQAVTPGSLRSAVRKYYLNWFYFRMFPERRQGGQ
jgi:polysaccharide pyruvyl transferase CsaB